MNQADNGNGIRVAVICDAGPTEDQIRNALGPQGEFQYLDTYGLSERLVRELRAVDPEIILVDHKVSEQATLDIIDDLQLQFPLASIVAILPNQDPILAQQVMLAGASAFVIQPFTQVNLQSTLRRVHDLRMRHKATRGSQERLTETTRPIKLIAVYSPRGGVGCSSLAANLAISLHEETGKNVLLFEGKLFFGHLDVFLNIRSQNNLADLMPHANKMDDALTKEVISTHVSGINVLVGPSNLQVAQGIRPDDLYNVLMGVQRLYDYVIIDVGSTLNENSVTLMDAADRVILVTTPDLACLRDISRFIQTTRTLGYPNEKIMVVLNRAGILGGVDPREIEPVLHHHLDGEIPEDAANALRSLNRGIPLVLRYSRSPASKAIVKLAQQIGTIQVQEVGSPLPSQASVDQSAREALIASSNFG
jgi:pilus assembly protein CpaE